MSGRQVTRTSGEAPSVTVSPGRTALVPVVCGVLGTACGALALAVLPSGFATLAGVVALVVFVPLMVATAPTLFRRGPAFVVDRRGITDRTATLAAGFVPWAEITRIESLHVDRNAFLAVHVRDAEAVLKRAPRPARSGLRNLVRRRGTPVIVPLQLLRPLTLDELLADIAAIAPDDRPGATPPAGPAASS